MAARRLLIVMLILLGLSTLAAALVPPQSLRDGAGTATTATEETRSIPPDTVPGGQEVQRTIQVGSGFSPVVTIAAGDQLSLTVKSSKPDQVEIPALGLVQIVAPDAPAHFDVLARTPDSYGIRLVSQDRIVARIVVAALGKGKKG